MKDIDNWAWERSKYWWNLLNTRYHTLYEMPEVSITDRIARRAGCCQVRRGKVEIVLYECYIKQEGEKYDATIGHEFVHAHNYFHYHQMGHGNLWKEGMRKIGLEPKDYHEYTIPNRKEITCICGRSFSIGPTQYKKMINEGNIYGCPYCKRLATVENGVIRIIDVVHKPKSVYFP